MAVISGNDVFEGLLSDMSNSVVDALPRILATALVFLVVFFGLKMAIRRLIGRIISKSEASDEERKKRINTLVGVVRRTAAWVLSAVFILTLMKQLGVDIDPLLTGAGILGLAVGLGAQEWVRDVISGFFVLIENRIRTGDSAIINGTIGTVENINLRTTTLRDGTGTVHTFQNGKINTLANRTKDWSAMVFDISVAYKENVDVVIAHVKEVADILEGDTELGPQILQPIEIFGLDKFGDGAMVIKARIKTRPNSQWVVGREFNRRLKAAFDATGIEFPFPQRTIYWGDSTNAIQIRKEE